ncbi:hypothetical protein PQR67_10860 [Paraburkholderia fungorum]|uniref:hypothetical protein n=1 Tax=Paraburkholderia fungorum TaxID=134537 RepID=UPI0038B9FFD1
MIWLDDAVQIVHALLLVRGLAAIWVFTLLYVAFDPVLLLTLDPGPWRLIPPRNASHAKTTRR